MLKFTYIEAVSYGAEIIQPAQPVSKRTDVHQ